ncbi:type II toxin-antitoxin system VapC family toxin [Streptomyces sp. NBC_01803]|uniref:type II toxin-antitoxin system VapC family toxin n=1 Tax=Streptomyces sp. NBC_01803 TaxID=2975946 RepID=UPI002DDA9C66|nr:type II toxin-antitoxin system VapC family toxin [Streptomyces sp. NBC_01803]WSA45634.1 type II toxin-antitoxin system VapC family toxin [Streptomyces sp. NBC_01803]
MYLLDTNVVSELRRHRPDPHVAAWIREVPDRSVFLSTLIIGEIRKGIENVRHRDGARARTLDLWLEDLRHRYADRVLPVTADIAEAWGRLSAPHRVPVIDGLLAATALVHDLTLVTRNVKDVRRTGVRLRDPFQPG